MIWAVALAVAALVAGGVYLVLGKDLLRVVVGVSLLGSGINLVLASAGRVDNVFPPFVSPTVGTLTAGVANPVPQALVLTAVVIGFSLVCLSFILLLALHDTTGSRSVDDLVAAEPRARADGSAPVLDDHA